MIHQPARRTGPKQHIISRRTYVMSPDDVEFYGELTLEQLRSGHIGSRLNALNVRWDGTCVLDLASGPGTWAIPLRDLGVGRIVCQDRSPIFLDYSRHLHRHRGITDVDYVEADITDLPYPDETFDVVICSRALYHSPDEKWTIRQVARVLKPGGGFYIESHSWRWMIRGYRGPLYKRLIAAPAPVIALALGRKLIPTVYAWFALTDRYCREAGLTLAQRLDNGRDHVFTVLYRRASA